MIQPVQSKEFIAAPGRAYRVAVRGARVPQSAVALIEWCDGRAENNGAFKRVFLERMPDGWHATCLAPEKAKALRILVFHWPQLGAQKTGKYECWCEEVTSPAPRRAKVAVAHQRAASGTTIEANIALMRQAVRDAAAQKVDLLCMSENLPDRGVAGPLEERAMKADDARLRPLYEDIRGAKLHAVFAFHEKTPRGIFISALLISPEGKIIGRYFKRQLTQSELEAGLTPGTEHGVFDTPLGKIGILICWDAWFPENAVELARRGAEIICFPLAGDGTQAHFDHVWRARALDNQVFLLASCTDNCSKAPSRVIAPDGNVLAETREPNSIAVADIDLNARIESHWLSVGPYDSEIRNVYDHSRLSKKENL
jgi:predicted amidohydrolase